MKNVGGTIKQNSDGKLFKVISERDGYKLLMSEELEVSRLTKAVVYMDFTETNAPFRAEGEWSIIEGFFVECNNWFVDDGSTLKLLDVMRAMVMR